MQTLRQFLVVSIVLLVASPALGQSADPTKSKLADLQSEIAALERQKKTGMYMVGGGVAAQFLSLAFIPTSEVNYNTGEVTDKGSSAIFYTLLAGGTVIGIIGVYNWYDAAQQLGPLKARKYDLSLVPTWDIGRKNAGVALTLRF